MLFSSYLMDNHENRMPMIEAYTRPLYQFFLVDPIAKMIRHQCKPRDVTFAACLSGVLTLPTLLLGWPKLAILFLMISGYLDTLDGTLARISNQTSKSGTVLDIVSDRIVEFAVIFGLFAYDPSHRALLSFFMLGSCYLCITSFLVVGIFSPNDTKNSFYYSPGIIERTEAFIFFIAMIALPNYFYLLASLFTILVLLTSFIRIKQFVQEPRL